MLLERIKRFLLGPNGRAIDEGRRRFLRNAALAAPAVIISGELAELLAPRKTILLPPAGGWAAWQETQLVTYVNIREDLEDMIYNVDPYRTPIVNLTKDVYRACFHEWDIDALADARA